MFCFLLICKLDHSNFLNFNAIICVCCGIWTFWKSIPLFVRRLFTSAWHFFTLTPFYRLNIEHLIFLSRFILNIVKKSPTWTTPFPPFPLNVIYHVRLLAWSYAFNDTPSHKKQTWVLHMTLSALILHLNNWMLKTIFLVWICHWSTIFTIEIEGDGSKTECFSHQNASFHRDVIKPAKVAYLHIHYITLHHEK